MGIIGMQDAAAEHNIERYVEKCDNDRMEQHFVLRNKKINPFYA